MNNNNRSLFCDYFWPCLWQLYTHLSQNFGSDSHFDVLNRSKSWLVQRLWHKIQIFPFSFFEILYKNTCFAFLHFLSYLLYQLRVRIIKHLKITVWTSVAWKTNIQLAKKWPDKVVKWQFISCYFLRVSQAGARPPSTSEAITFEPIEI